MKTPEKRRQVRTLGRWEALAGSLIVAAASVLSVGLGSTAAKLSQ